MNRKKLLAFLAALTAAVSAMTVPASAEELFGDINTDGAIDSVDAACILQYAAYVGAGGTLDLKAFLNGENQPVPEVPDTDSSLTILAWTDSDLATMQEMYLDKYPDAQLNISLIGDNGGGAEEQYKTVLDAGDPVDLYVVENGWARSYMDHGYALPLSSLGLTEEDYADAYPYARELGRGADGVLYGAAYTISPGGYCYNADLAEQYLGITSPEEMQARIADWDGFTQTASDLHAASGGAVTMTVTLSDLWKCFSMENTRPVYQNGQIQTEKFADFISLAQEHITNGYVNPKIVPWTVEWTEAGRNGETLGYFYASWNLTDGAQLYQNGGSDGNWALAAGPQEYYWGGMMFCAAPQCDSRTAAENFLRCFTVDADVMEEYCLTTGLMVNNRTATENIMASGQHDNALLGGQDEYAILHETAMNMDVTAANASEKDELLQDEFYIHFSNNYKESAETILSTFVDDMYFTHGIG